MASRIFSVSSRCEAYLARRGSISFKLCFLASSTAWSHCSKQDGGTRKEKKGEKKRGIKK